MNVTDPGSDRNTRVFGILAVVWGLLLVATALFFPAMAVVPEGPAADFLKIAFLVVGGTMMSLCVLLVILSTNGFVSLPSTPEPEDPPWPMVLVGGFVLTCMAAGALVFRTADRLGTEAALRELAVLFGVFMLPFILATLVPMIIGRFYSGHALKAKNWGYVAAVLIDLGMWIYLSGTSPLATLKRSSSVAVVLVGYVIYLALRRRRAGASG